MGVHLINQKRSEPKMLLSVCLILVSCTILNAFPASSEDDRFTDREYPRPGAHQLASWITAQLRRNEYLPQQPEPELPIIPYRLSGIQGKRNSELTNSMMGIPRNMIDNGKK